MGTGLNLSKFVVLVVVAFSFAVSHAAISKEELKSRRSALTSKGTHRRLSRAHALMAKDKLDDAIAVLNRLLKSTEKRPHEKAQVLQAMGFAYAQKEKFGKALSYLQQSIDLGVLPYNATMSTLYTIAQVNVAQEKHGVALKKINEWFSLADEPSPDAYVLKATIFAQTKKQKEALRLVTKAIDMTDKPKESWLSFAVAMNYELDKFAEAARLLEKLAGLYPEKKKYWKQLSGVYLNLEKNPQALATLELAHKGNYLEQDQEIMNLVSLFIYGGIPLKGAKLLEKSLAEGKVKKTQKNYEILGDAWAQAEEMDKALVAYAASAKMAKDGRIFAKQGRIYLEQENWEKANTFLTQGLKKGKLKKPQHIHMALGVARFNLKKFDSAISSFEAAKKASKKVEKQADQWIGYTQAEDKRVNPDKYAQQDTEEAETETL
ncbi:MAG: tetratricopeptide repeat protein [Bdellovibrionales bacterium]|nr:tetratricopeptide repeat protein [Bdellovibrionales bacterium]NQZ18426.1 tetratricopeptide repeat protein [Bdellovibrionales bacterium]